MDCDKNLKYYGKLRTYKMLLEEIIEELETEENKNVKIESVQIETQTKRTEEKETKVIFFCLLSTI